MSKNLTKTTQALSTNQTWQKALALSKLIITKSAEVSHYEMKLTLTDTFSKPAIRSVFRGENGKLGYTTMRVLVERFLNSFSFATKLNDTQIDIFTVDALEHFSYESLDDVLLFFKMARTGKFGTAKHGIDSNTVFGDWFLQYLEQKAEQRENQYIENTNAQKSQTSSQAVKATYSIQQKRKQREAIEKEIDKMAQTFDRQMLEDTILSWSKDPNQKPYVNYLKRKRRVIK